LLSKFPSLKQLVVDANQAFKIYFTPLMAKHKNNWLLACFFPSALYATLVGGIVSARAEIPTILTDKIQQGSGVIDLLKNVTSADLGSYLKSNQAMYLAVDVNENASGLESAKSQGVAIKQMSLVLTTSSGDFSFTDFVTGSSAKLLESGSKVAGNYQTLFGTSGSNDLTSATKNFDMSRLDDVITFRNISYTGDIKSAHLEVQFVKTATGGSTGANEDFFDFSGGFEDFAILSNADAKTLQAAAIGKADAPATVTYTPEATPLSLTVVGPAPAPEPVVAVKTDPAVANAPAAPAPPFLLLVFGAALLGIHQIRASRTQLRAS
jgi:hypothetical protein